MNRLHAAVTAAAYRAPSCRGRSLGNTVSNDTGLTGEYDFVLRRLAPMFE